MLTENDLTQEQKAQYDYLRHKGVFHDGRNLKFYKQHKFQLGSPFQEYLFMKVSELIPPGTEWRVENESFEWGEMGMSGTATVTWLKWTTPKTKEEFLKELEELMRIELGIRQRSLSEQEQKYEEERKHYEEFMEIYKGI